jgi:hypothetical protein
MAALYDLLPQVAPFVVDCPEGVQTFALRRAASRFLADSHAWTLPLTADADGTQAMELSAFTPALPAGTVVLAALNLTIDGREPIITPRWIVNQGSIYLDPAPALGAELELTVAVGGIPQTITELPDLILARYGGAIADLALHYIYATTGRPYYDREGAETAYVRYRQGLHEANVDRLTGGRSGVAALTNPIPDYF